MNDIKLMELKDSFCDLLRSVNRPHTEDIISELERIGFFHSPASRRDHLSYEGGLLEHSMNVYRVATLLANDMRLLRCDFSVCLNHPLVPLIHTADTLAAQIVEVNGTRK